MSSLTLAQMFPPEYTGFVPTAIVTTKGLSTYEMLIIPEAKG